jgi:regulator of protease activity HflC (stomatin/prohibitin superfamily)
MKLLKLTGIAALIISLSGCLTRIETGEVGVRLNASKQIEGNELLPGSWNQTLVGNVLTFPVKDIAIDLENKTPMTSDNSALADFDVTVVYGINPASVAELYSTKSKSFHNFKNGDILLMQNYMTTLVNNASYKAVRQYKALEVVDNRVSIENEIRAAVAEQLKSEKLDSAISLTVVQVRNILPNKEILDSATAYVRAQNELKVKSTEVEIAKKESERQQVLAANGPQTIEYMKAQAQVTLANAVAAGKIQTVLIPHGMTMFSMTK